MEAIYTPQTKTQDPRMFFGEGRGIQEFVELPYPEFLKFQEQQRAQDWSHDEFSLKLDAVQLASANQATRHIFTSNLQSQILGDTAQGRGPAWLLPYISDPSLESAFVEWARSEILHSRSYSYILTSMYPNPRIVLSMIEQKPEVLARFSQCMKAYDVFFATPTKRNLVLLIAAINILEGLSFYTSFICNFGFANMGLFESVSKYLQSISKDECVSGDTEVLTNKGWKKIQDYDINDKLAQVDIQTNEISFINPSRKIKTETNKVYTFNNEYISQTVTQNHRMPVIMYQSKIAKFELPENLVYGRNYIPTGGYTTHNDSVNNALTVFQRFLISAQADGHISKRHTGSISGYNIITFSFSKERKISRLFDILKQNSFNYTELPLSPAEGNVKEKRNFSVQVPAQMLKNIDIKDFSTWIDLASISTQWCDSFMEELVQWGGYIPKDNSTFTYYSNTSKICVDIVQAIGHISGYSVVMATQENNRSETYNDVYKLYIHKDKIKRSGQTIVKEVTETVTVVDMYCVTVPSGAFLVRKDNKVSVTGNCLHLGLTQRIIKNWREGKDGKEWKELWHSCRDEIRQMYIDAIEGERVFAKYLFQYGNPLKDVTEDLLNQSTEYYANKRMKNIGITKYSNLNKDPLPFAQSKYLTSKSVAGAPQEVTINQYLKNIVKKQDDMSVIARLFNT